MEFGHIRGLRFDWSRAFGVGVSSAMAVQVFVLSAWVTGQLGILIRYIDLVQLIQFLVQLVFSSVTRKHCWQVQPARKTRAKREYVEISDASDIAALDRCYPCSELEKPRSVNNSQYESNDGNVGGPKDVGSSNLQRDLMGALNCNKDDAFHAALALQVFFLLSC
jgi:hypothetical protein